MLFYLPKPPPAAMRVKGTPEQLAKFYHLYQEMIWPGYAAHHQYINSREARIAKKAIESGELIVCTSGAMKLAADMAYKTVFTLSLIHI